MVIALSVLVISVLVATGTALFGTKTGRLFGASAEALGGTDRAAPKTPVRRLEAFAADAGQGDSGTPDAGTP